jgi:tRNA threonylcarbamoyladenosine biosynthesis protein TsaB
LSVSHGSHLLTLIHQTLKLASLPLEAIDFFAVSQGPGSFTGLRIGLATVMGLGQALHRTVCGVDTLEALAMQAWEVPFQVCPVLDARKGEVFGAAFRPTSEGPKRLTPNLVMPPEAFCANISEPTVLLGTGVETYRTVWESRLGELAIFPPPWLGTPCSVQVGMLALAQMRRSPGGPQAVLTPIYGRASEAEVNWSRRHLNGL